MKQCNHYKKEYHIPDLNSKAVRCSYIRHEVHLNSNRPLKHLMVIFLWPLLPQFYRDLSLLVDIHVHSVPFKWSSDVRSFWLYGQFFVPIYGPKRNLCNRFFPKYGHSGFMVNFYLVQTWTIYQEPNAPTNLMSEKCGLLALESFLLPLTLRNDVTFGGRQEGGQVSLTSVLLTVNAFTEVGLTRIWWI